MPCLVTEIDRKVDMCFYITHEICSEGFGVTGERIYALEETVGSILLHLPDESHVREVLEYVSTVYDMYAHNPLSRRCFCTSMRTLLSLICELEYYLRVEIDRGTGYVRFAAGRAVK